MSNVIAALRQAVEQRERISLDDIDAANLLAEIDALKAQEPVAWATYPPTGCVTQSEAEAARWEHKGWDVVPLYTSPKPGEPR